MASSHGSPARWHRATEYYRKVNPPLLRLRKAPERVYVMHRATMTRPTRQGQPSTVAKNSANCDCQRSNAWANGQPFRRSGPR
jgi:hypothetical protein